MYGLLRQGDLQLSAKALNAPLRDVEELSNVPQFQDAPGRLEIFSVD
jgi:hypothetical protein